MNDLRLGCIVKFNIKGNKFSEEGYAYGGTFCASNELVVYQKIDLDAFPSCNDFKGKQAIIKHNSYGVVLKKLGRPLKVNQNEKWKNYDVYEILTAKLNKCHVFRASLEPVSSNDN